MKLEIITPESIVYEAEVDYVTLPTQKGEVGILPGHIPLVTLLEAGQVEAFYEGKSEVLAVGDGFAEVVADTVTVMTEQAIEVSAIDPEEVERARAAAQAELREAIEKNFDPMEIAEIEGSYRFALAQQLVRGKRRF